MYNIYSTYYTPNQDKKFHSVKKRKKGLSFLTYFIITTIVIIFFFIFINKASFFQIQKIEITSNTLSKIELPINSEISNIITKKYTNILFSSSKNIRKYLQTNFLEISNIEVNKEFFKKKIYVSYSFREPKYTWCDSTIINSTSDSKNCFLIDSNGLLFKNNNIKTPAKPLTLLKDKNILLIENEYYQDLELAQKIPSNILYIVNNFSSILEKRNIYSKKAIIKNNNLIIFVLDILDTENDLKNIIEVKFSLEKDLDEQLEKSSTLINYLSNIDLEKVEYIDLRVKEKIYYR